MSERTGSAESGPDPRAWPPAAPPQDPARPDEPAAAEPGHTPADSGDGSAAPEMTARIAELEDQRLQALAELDNLRKRCVRQVGEARDQARAEVARQWLPVVDNLERALAHSQADPAVILEGVRAVRAQALDLLAGLGFPRRDDLGASFDPARHEAATTRPDPDAPEGSVVEVLQPGYGDGDRQLRPAQVVVAKAG
jgi:molecular chaperone GrpE